MRNKNEKGFSLIELAVVIFIIAIMTVVIAPRYSSYRNSKSISYAKTQIITDLRYTQDYTLSTKKLLNGDHATGGFGIRFKKGKSSYVIFGDGGDKPNHKYDGGNELFETVDLVGDVTISDLTVNGVSVNYVNYVSEPPYGKVYIDGSGDATLVITFTNAAGSTGIITVKSSGSIS